MVATAALELYSPSVSFKGALPSHRFQWPITAFLRLGLCSPLPPPTTRWQWPTWVAVQPLLLPASTERTATTSSARSCRFNSIATYDFWCDDSGGVVEITASWLVVPPTRTKLPAA